MLKLRLDLRRFDRPAPFRHLEPLPEEINVLHKQHAGAVPRPRAEVGRSVAAGEVLADVRDDELGVPTHTPFAGRVKEVNTRATVIERLL